MSLPKYVERSGEQIPKIPYYARDALLNAYFASAEHGNLRDFCDEILNAPNGGRMRFIVLGSKVLVTALRVKRMTSTHPHYVTKGTSPECDVAIWAPVLQTRAADGGLMLPKFFWQPLYVFVDSGPAMASGREVYGYPKVGSDIAWTETGGIMAPVAVTALTIHPYNPATGAVRTKVLEIAAHGAAPKATSRARTETAVNAFIHNAIATETEIFGALSGLVGDAAALAGIELTLPSMGMPSIFLKQFRDAVDPEAACYQAYIDAAPKTRDVRDMGVIAGNFDLRLFHADSMAIAAKLGMAAVNPLSTGLWVDFDFELGPGRVVLKM